MPERREYVALDLETTGLMAETDRIVEIGAVRFDGQGRELGRFERLVNPQRAMSAAAYAIHGIGDADLVGAEPARVVLPEFLDWLGDAETTLLLAHNASFDAGFLGRELRRNGMVPAPYVVADTLALARRQVPDARDHRLDTLARLLDLDPDGAHRALADSLRVMAVWLRLGGPSLPESALVSYPIADTRGAPPVPVGWERLSAAIAQGARVRIEYAGGTRGTGPREVTPRGFANRGGIAYLVAYCHLDSFEKSFRLDRVRSYEVVVATAAAAPIARGRG